jgi:UDP-N-acetylmuramoylalanine-D-glutamate ligase
MTRRLAIDPDALTMDAIHGGLLDGVPVTVLGFARSGIALARFLADTGARVTVYDSRPVSELDPADATREIASSRTRSPPSKLA